MTGAVRKRIGRARAEAGFTLIELLVVITILGILAAVVIFALGGVGDRGEKNAKATEAQTLRTAQETYCAKNGRYATLPELLGRGPGGMKLLARPPKYHIVDPGGAVKCGDTFTLTDVSSPPVLGAAPEVGRGPVAVAIDPRANRVYVLNETSNDMSVIDTTNDRVIGDRPTPVGNRPTAVVVNPANGKVYVVSGATNDDDKITVFDGSEKTVIDWTYPGSPSGQAIALNPANDEVYVCGDAGTLIAIDGDDERVSEISIREGGCGPNIVVSTAKNRAYWPMSDGWVAMAGDAPHRVSEIPPPPDVRIETYGLAINAAGNEVYSVARDLSRRGSDANGLAVFHADDNSTEFVIHPQADKVNLQTQPTADSSTGKIYLYGGIDAGGDAVLRFDPTAEPPRYDGQQGLGTDLGSETLAVDPVTQRLYMGYEGGRNGGESIRLVDLRTLAVSTIAGTPRVNDIAIDPDTHKVYAPSRAANKVYVVGPAGT